MRYALVCCCASASAQRRKARESRKPHASTRSTHWQAERAFSSAIKADPQGGIAPSLHVAVWSVRLRPRNSSTHTTAYKPQIRYQNRLLSASYSHLGNVFRRQNQPTKAIEVLSQSLTQLNYLPVSPEATQVRTQHRCVFFVGCSPDLRHAFVDDNIGMQVRASALREMALAFEADEQWPAVSEHTHLEICLLPHASGHPHASTHPGE